MAKSLINKRSVGSVRVVDRIVDLLTVLERAEQPVGLSEISRASDLHKATAQRLLTALERRGFVCKERGRYQLGSAVAPLAKAFLSGNNLTKSALPVLEELVSITGETASVYVRHDLERVLIQRVESPSPLRYVVRIGERLPIYSGSSGQVLCAAMPEATIKRLLGQIGEIRLVSGKSLNKEQMLKRLDQVRRQGFAVSFEESMIGIASVAAPVTVQEKSVIAAVVLVGPSSRIAMDHIPQLSGEVRRAGREIAERYCRV